MMASGTEGTRPGCSRVAVVIVNYRTAALVEDCLRSLEPEIARRPGSRVVVSDCLSGDDSVPRLREAIVRHGWGSWASVMPLAKNGGFAYGNNEVFRAILAGHPLPEFVWMLNPDTVVRAGGMEALAAFLEREPKAAIVGSRLINPDDSVQIAAYRFPNLLSELDSAVNFGPVTVALEKWRVWLRPELETGRVDWVCGASMMMRREVLERVGLLDEKFFMYFEELDLCLRAKRTGHEVWHVAESRVVHLVSQATGMTEGSSGEKRRPAYWFRARRWFWVKNHGVLGAMCADAIRIFGTPIGRVIAWVRGKPNPAPAHFLGDLVRNSVFVAGFRS